LKLSLVMPVYNEGATLERVLKQLGDVEIPIEWELLIVDDGSSDGAVDQVLRAWVPGASRVRIIKGRRNQGKGAALREGFRLAEGDILGVQDADLEYDPAHIPGLLAPILERRSEVVFGTREFSAHSAFSFWYVMGNRLLSLVASALFDRYVTDAYTGYKFFTRECYERLRLKASGFEIEAELTGGLLRQGVRLYEVPISYTARGREDGKKIRPRDGLKGVATLARVRLFGS
jgi:glycosyltransferase involved in cell wall biosynthesis